MGLARDQYGQDSDSVLIGAKAEFLQHLVTVIQFQQQASRRSLLLDLDHSPNRTPPHTPTA
jgi:hypothetical protein